MNIFKTKPLAKQQEAFDKSKDAKAFAYFMEMGTGKTKVAIDNASYLYFSRQIEALLIFAPKGVYLNWIKNELPKHMAAPYKVAFWSSESGVRDKEWLAKLSDVNYQVNGLKIICMNTEAIAHESGQDFAEKFLDEHVAMVVFDESTSLKTPGSKTSKAAERLGRLCTYKRIMTGTPITKNPLDIYGQVRFLGKELLGFPNFQTFKHFYADIIVQRMGNRSFPKIIGYRRVEKLQACLDTFSFRVLKSDCFDLPPRTYQRRYVSLTPEQARHYKALENECMTMLNGAGDAVTVNLAIVQLMKMHQVCCGHVKDDAGQLHILPSNRINTLLEVLEEATGKVIIWCKYKEDVRMVTEALPAGTWVQYSGDVSQKDREENLSLFLKGDKSYFVGTASTGGKGLTMTEAKTTVWFSYDYDLEKRLQADDRNYRYGQDEAVTVVEIAAEGTIDEIILDCLRDKHSLAQLVLDKKTDLLRSKRALPIDMN